MEADLISAMLHCASDATLNGTIDILKVVEVCDGSVAAYKGYIVGMSSKLASVAALAAFSFSSCIAYLALPDYRYRRRLTDYVRHLTSAPGRVSLDDVIKYVDAKTDDEVSELLKPAPGASEGKLDNCKSYDGLLKMMEYFLQFPGGEHPTHLLKSDAVTDRIWFSQTPGLVYRLIYHSLFDNKFCLASAGLSAFIVFIATAELFGWGSLISEVLGMGSALVVLLAVLAVGFVGPAILAFIGKSMICKSGRKKIDQAGQIYLRIGNRMSVDAMEGRIGGDAAALEAQQQ